MCFGRPAANRVQTVGKERMRKVTSQDLECEHRTERGNKRERIVRLQAIVMIRRETDSTPVKRHVCV